MSFVTKAWQWAADVLKKLFGSNGGGVKQNAKVGAQSKNVQVGKVGRDADIRISK